MTSYVILKQHRDDPNSASSGAGGWFQVGPAVESISAEAAIRKAIDGKDGGVYVAIPTRSFTPVTVTVETKRTVKFA